MREITGLKGMAAIIVMLSHYAIAFFPAVWNGEYELEHIAQVEKIIHRTPLYFFANGSLMVSVFWCISGFLIAYSWFQNKSTLILKKRILGRYFKLVIPIALSMIIAYVFHVCGLFYNSVAATYTWSEWLKGFYEFEPSFFTCIYDGIFGIFFIGSGQYNPILWTIKGEVFGICMSALFLLIWGNEERKKRNRAYVFWGIMVSLFYYPLLCFLIGIFVAEKYLQGKGYAKKKGILYLGTAIVLGSFLPIWSFIPAEITLINGMTISIGDIFRAVSAGLLLSCAVNIASIQKILSKKAFLFLGNISMYLYIYHFLILCSFSCWLFVHINTYLKNSYVLNALISIICGLMLTIWGASTLKKVVEGVNRKLLDKVYSFL